MELKNINIETLIPYENNPRINDGAVEAVAESIRQCGYISPIIVDENMIVLAGHTRLKALKRLGYSEVPVMIAEGLNEEQKKKFRILDNKTNEFAEWDFNALAVELEELNFDNFDFGFEETVIDEYGTDFSLADENRQQKFQITFYFSEEQKTFIEKCLEEIGDNYRYTYGNEHKAGNRLFEVCRQWEEQKKLK